MNNCIESLSKCKLFNNIEEKTLTEIFSSINYTIRDYNKNENIFKKNELIREVGIIISGCVELQKILPSGSYFSLFYKKKGDTFGGASTFSSNTFFTSRVFSKTKSRVLFLRKEDILSIIRHPTIGENFLKAFADSVINFEKKLELLSYSSIQKKLAFFLIDQKYILNKDIIKLNSTKTDWAEYLNVSRPSLYRELNKMENDNIIKINDKNIIILDEDKLIKLLEK